MLALTCDFARLRIDHCSEEKPLSSVKYLHEKGERNKHPPNPNPTPKLVKIYLKLAEPCGVTAVQQ